MSERTETTTAPNPERVIPPEASAYFRTHIDPLCRHLAAKYAHLLAERERGEQPQPKKEAA